MQKLILTYDHTNVCINVSFPLTSPTGNVRVRTRNSNAQYGYQTYKDDIKDSSCYIDWQIEYDTRDENESFSRARFIRSVNGEQKYFYCLSDFIKFFHDNGIITDADLINVRNSLNNTHDDEFIISNSHLTTKQFRNPLPNCNSIRLSNFDINPSSTVFPLYIISLANNYDVEIGLYEGGFATSSLMPHLYVCIPFVKLDNFRFLNGRASNRNERGILTIDRNNVSIFLNIFNLIGLLTTKHKSDVLDIIETIL